MMMEIIMVWSELMSMATLLFRIGQRSTKLLGFQETWEIQELTSCEDSLLRECTDRCSSGAPSCDNTSTSSGFANMERCIAKYCQISLYVWYACQMFSIAWSIALELGSDTRLVGMVMGQATSVVFVTYIEEDILGKCNQNIILNGSLLCNGESTMRVRELDF